jgi:2-amino-4-hydroxy-6-hydroxymethyldihydropteridine diphosphokinase
LIITLDPNFCPAEMGCESLQRLDGRGQVGERDSRRKIHLADSEWQMADSEWQMADGEWQMADGEWQIANG